MLSDHEPMSLFGLDIRYFLRAQSSDKVSALEEAGMKRAHVFNPDDEYQPLQVSTRRSPTCPAPKCFGVPVWEKEAGM